MITVTLKFPGDGMQEVLLAEVPHVGEDIRLANGGANSMSVVVEHILHVEGRRGAEPTVIVTVRPRQR